MDKKIICIIVTICATICLAIIIGACSLSAGPSNSAIQTAIAKTQEAIDMSNIIATNVALTLDVKEQSPQPTDKLPTKTVVHATETQSTSQSYINGQSAYELGNWFDAAYYFEDVPISDPNYEDAMEKLNYSRLKMGKIGYVGNMNSLVTMNADGTDRNIILRYDFWLIGAAWSKNGKNVLVRYINPDNLGEKWEIFDVNKNSRELFFTQWDGLPYAHLREIIWSPDGNNIATHTNYHMWIFELSTGNFSEPQCVDEINEYNYLSSIAWSPEENYILFGIEGKIDSWFKYHISSDSCERLFAYAENDNWIRNVNISPTGSKIAYTYSPLTHKEIYVMDADGSNRKKIYGHSYAGINSITWSPDGSKIAFCFDIQFEEDGVFIVDINTQEVVHVSGEMCNSLYWFIP